MATLLQIVQRAAGELGISVPTSVVGNTATDVVQLFYLVNGLGNDLLRQYEWEQSTQRYIFETQYLTTTGNITANSPIVTGIPSTTGIVAGTWAVTGTGLPSDVTVLSVDSATQVTLNQDATTSGTGVTLNFGQVAYALPSGFNRLVDRTNWDKSKHWEQLGPETAQQWEFLKSGYISTGPRIRWRIMGRYYQIWPIITSTEVLSFEYVTSNWILSSSVTDNVPDKSEYTVDTDTCIFPDRLMVTGLKLRYFDAKGFDSTSLQLVFNNELNISGATDTGAPILAMAPRPSSVLVGWSNIPDSGLGQ